MPKSKTYGPHKPKAFAVHWPPIKAITTLVSATTAGKARYSTYYLLRDLGYDCEFTEVKTWRDKEFDDLAMKATKDGQFFIDIQDIKMPDKYDPDRDNEEKED